MRTIAQWALIIAALAGVAMAQPTEAEKRADALFQEGRRLLEAGEVAAACPKFEESQRLDPGLGTLLNLANCYERTERLASALAAFRSAEEGARAAGDRTREREASDRARALESRVSRVTIKLAPGERPAGFEVRRSGAVVPPLDFGRAIAVDPGAIAIEASAPGHTAFRQSLAIGAGRTVEQIEIPMLQPAGAPTERPRPTDEPVVTGPTRPTTVDRGAGRRRLGLIVGGVGVAALGAGVGLGLKANADYPHGCTDEPGGCTAAQVNAADDARALGNLGTVVGAVGVAAVAAGAVLYLTAPRARAVEVAPNVSGSGATVVVRGRF
jgi:hypothetical protein